MKIGQKFNVKAGENGKFYFNADREGLFVSSDIGSFLECRGTAIEAGKKYFLEDGDLLKYGFGDKQIINVELLKLHPMCTFPCCQGIPRIRIGIPPLSEIVSPMEFRNRNENGQKRKSDSYPKLFLCRNYFSDQKRITEEFQFWSEIIPRRNSAICTKTDNVGQ